jgi:hypothetical protein
MIKGSLHCILPAVHGSEFKDFPGEFLYQVLWMVAPSPDLGHITAFTGIDR